MEENINTEENKETIKEEKLEDVNGGMVLFDPHKENNLIFDQNTNPRAANGVIIAVKSCE